MGMFDTYDSLNPNYIPDNSTNKIEQYKYIEKELPYKVYDIKNRFVGYKWNYNDRFVFPISVDNTICVDEDALIYTNKDECPDTHTVGTHIGQKAYNTIDSKSWTYCGESNNIYLWVEDDFIIYSAKGDKEITLSTDMNERKIEVTIYNFKWEVVYKHMGDIGASTTHINIDNELNEVLVPGLYYVVINISGEDTSQMFSKYNIIIE